MSRTRSDQRVRYAVIGAGPFTQRRVLPAFEHAARSELCALIAPDEQRRVLLARRHGVEHTGGLDELERVLQQSGAQAIYLCAPAAQHRALTERAARAGVHVLCDAPMAETLEDCRAMHDCCKARGVQLMLAYRQCFDDAQLEALAVARSGRLGLPRIFDSLHVRAPRRAGRSAPRVGALWELLIPPINSARHLFGSEPIAAMACAARLDLRLSDAEATIGAWLAFEDGGHAQLTVSCAASDTSAYRVLGEKGRLTVEPAFACDEPVEHVLAIGDNRVERRFEPHDSIARQLAALSRAILDGGDVFPDASEGSADVRVLEALQQSARSGRRVDLPRCPQLGRIPH